MLLLRHKSNKMKKIVLVALLIAQGVFAQTDKGTWIFSGKTGAEISSSKSKTTSSFGSTNDRITAFEFNPTAGYFIIDHLYVGISSTLRREHINRTVSIQKNTYLTLMPTVGYFIPMEGKLRPFFSAGAGLARLNTDTEISESNIDPFLPPSFNDKNTGYAVALSGGVSYFLSSSISLDAQVNYNYLRLTSSSNSNAVNTVSGLGLSIGFSIFL